MGGYINIVILYLFDVCLSIVWLEYRVSDTPLVRLIVLLITVLINNTSWDVVVSASYILFVCFALFVCLNLVLVCSP